MHGPNQTWLQASPALSCTDEEWKGAAWAGQGASEGQGSDLSRLLGPHQAKALTACYELDAVGDCRAHSTDGPRSQEGDPQEEPCATTKARAAARLGVKIGGPFFPYPTVESKSGKLLSPDSLAVAHVCANSLA